MIIYNANMELPSREKRKFTNKFSKQNIAEVVMNYVNFVFTYCFVNCLPYERFIAQKGNKKVYKV